VAQTAGKILIVDDERVVHAYLKAVLHKAGYTVTGAADAVQGPMQARRDHPDLIILDISMPAGGGFKALERMRSLGATSATPVLVYSSHSKEEIQKQIQESYDLTILRKPASPMEIVAAVKKLLEQA
jgi:DNA-binding response OmpR family regulator